jgi:[ribosomal protein S18]-alanine N-acetyltransferase
VTQTRLRPAGLADIAVLATVHAASFPSKEQWNVDSISRTLAMPGCYAFLHSEGGMIIARAAADEAEILTLGVSPLRRQQGLGRRLLDAAAAEAARRGADTLYLEVSERNEAARILYSHAGFVQSGRRDRYYADGSAALVLALRLSSTRL